MQTNLIRKKAMMIRTGSTLLATARHGSPRGGFVAFMQGGGGGGGGTRSLVSRTASLLRSQHHSCYSTRTTTTSIVVAHRTGRTTPSSWSLSARQQPPSSLILNMEPHGHHKQNLLCMLYSRWSSRSSSTSSSGGNDAKTPQRPENGGSATDQKDESTLAVEERPPSPMQNVDETTKAEIHRPNLVAASSRLASGAVAATHELELRLKRVAVELNLGDQLSVIGIAVFTALLLVAPYAAKYMKQHNYSEYEIDSSDDPVDQLAKLARHEWGYDDDAASSSKSNVVETLLKDLFKSQALQRAAQDFVVQIIQSEQFKNAVSRLVHELWTDLVTDPETLAQIIEVLRRAIADPDIEKAVQNLVLHVFVQEPAVREALIKTIETLGTDERVNKAVITLLTESTHATLNDPEILDHSMEFATDVVGDDIVQRTAGEALRKSVGHAVKPATTVVLSSLGVGLLLFSVLAVGYSRSSEQEAALFESAARSLQSNAAYGIMRIVTWPLRQVDRLVELANRMVVSSPPRPVLEQCGRWTVRLGAFSAICLASVNERLSTGWLSFQTTGHQLSVAIVSCCEVVMRAAANTWTGAISWTWSIARLFHRRDVLR